MNMQALLKQAQNMQKELTKVEAELKDRTYESTIGGGSIKVIAKGNMNIESITIDDALLEKDNKDDLQDMLISAINDVLQQVASDKEQTMNSITGGVKMPGGF